MENTMYGKRREGRWTPIWAKAQDTRANPNSSETHLVRKRLDIELLRALSLRIMMMMTAILKGETYTIFAFCCSYLHTSMVRMSSVVKYAPVNDLDAFQENERICS